MADFTELFASEVLSEDVRSKLAEAWEAKVKENKAEALAELREEFSQRYEHDKSVMVEALDQFIGESLQKELAELKQDRDAMVEARVGYKKAISEHAQMLDRFVNSTFAKEITELREDREANKASVKKLEEFTLRKLTSELNELREEEQKLVDTRVQLISEGKQAIKEAKAKFIALAAEKSNAFISEALRKEIGQLKEDITEARKNAFGRKIMEAYAAEFMASHFADATELKKLSDKIIALEGQVQEKEQVVESKQQAIADAERKIRIAEDTLKRERIMKELMAPLSKDKRGIMEDLLGTVSTEKLRESYQKYLPSVLNESGQRPGKKPLIENAHEQRSSVATGDKNVIVEESAKPESDIIMLKKLAGIAK
jgi:hypothetical protein